MVVSVVGLKIRLKGDTEKDALDESIVRLLNLHCWIATFITSSCAK